MSGHPAPLTQHCLYPLLPKTTAFDWMAVTTFSWEITAHIKSKNVIVMVNYIFKTNQTREIGKE